MIPTIEPIFILLRAKSICRFLRRYHDDTPTTNEDPTAKHAITVCRNLLIATGESATAQKSTISFLTVSGLNSIPTGYCIQAFATNIHSAESTAPKNTIHVDRR